MLLGIRWGSLRTKIIAWSFVPTAIILSTVALVTYVAYQQVTEQLVIERNRELTRLSASQLTTALRAYANLLDTEARRSGYQGNDPTAQREALKESGSRLAVFDGGVLLLDTFGAVVAAVPERPEVLGHNWSDRDYYRQMLRAAILGSPSAVLSDIVADGPGGAEVVAVATPITGSRGEFVGLLVGMFRVGARSGNALYGSIVKLRIGESGSAYVVDGTGRLVYHTDRDRIGDDVSELEVVQRALGGQTDAIRSRDFEGRDTVASYAPVPGTSWGLVTQESWGELLRASQGYRGFLLLLLALGVVVPAAVVAVGIRRLTKPIAELIGAAEKVAGGDFGHTISADTGDEIQELADQFNRMSSQLQESYTNLEHRVATRTRELAALNAIATVVSQSLDLDEILTGALDTTLQVMDIEAGGIYLLDEADQILNIAVQRGFSPEFVAGVDRLKVGEGFSGRVVQSGQPLVVRDVSADPRLTRAVVREEGLRSMAIVPLSSKGKVLGTLFSITHGFREFTDQDVQLLSSIGHQIGVAVDSANLFQAEQRRAEQFRVMAEVGHRVTSILDIDEVLVQIVRLIQQSFDYDHVDIALIEDDDLIVKAGAGNRFGDPDFQPPLLKVGGQGIMAWVARNGEPLVVPDVSQDPRYLSLPDSLTTRSELAVPLKTKTAVIGVLDVQSDHLDAFDESDLVVLQSLANQAAVVIENAQLYGQAQQLAVMEERQRLARELHDAVTQTLFSASLIAEALPELWEADQGEGRQLLGELRQLSRGALAEMRTLLLELRPASLVEADLGDLLRQLGEAATGRTGAPVHVSVEGRYGLPPEVHVTLYRIAQEALNNVVKHARACEVEVYLYRTLAPSTNGGEQRMSAELQVSDDGCGFDPDSIPPDRLGLGIIRERVEAIGAELTLETQPGRGTRITVVWQGSSPATGKDGA